MPEDFYLERPVLADQTYVGGSPLFLQGTLDETVFRTLQRKWGVMTSTLDGQQQHLAIDSHCPRRLLPPGCCRSSEHSSEWPSGVSPVLKTSRTGRRSTSPGDFVGQNGQKRLDAFLSKQVDARPENLRETTIITQVLTGFGGQSRQRSCSHGVLLLAAGGTAKGKEGDRSDAMKADVARGLEANESGSEAGTPGRPAARKRRRL